VHDSTGEVVAAVVLSATGEVPVVAFSGDVRAVADTLGALLGGRHDPTAARSLVGPSRARCSASFAQSQRKEVMHMAKTTAAAPTNERILAVLQELQAQLAESQRREEQIARDLARLLAK
jgi:hypothetical protein